QRGLYGRWAKAGREGLGANLAAPADPGTESYPARPEWYFLFLFQLLKYFEGEQEVIGTVVIPQAVGILLALLPLLGYGRMRRFGHVVGVIVVVAFLTGSAALTYLAIAADLTDPIGRWLMSRVGTVLVPTIGGVILAVFGVLGVLRRGRLRQAVSVVGSVLLAALLGTGGYLTYLALSETYALPEQIARRVERRLTKDEKTAPQDV